jgi:hypothetical protein
VAAIPPTVAHGSARSRTQSYLELCRFAPGDIARKQGFRMATSRIMWQRLWARHHRYHMGDSVLPRDLGSYGYAEIGHAWEQNKFNLGRRYGD